VNGVGSNGFFDGCLAQMTASSSQNVIPLFLSILVVVLTEVVARWHPRFLPFPEKVWDAIKIAPRVLVLLFLREIATGTIEYLPEPRSWLRFWAVIALVLTGNLVGILIHGFARQFREDNATNLRLSYEDIVRRNHPVNLWPATIVIAGILVMGFGVWIAAPSDSFAKDCFVVLAFLTIGWSGFLPLTLMSLAVIASARRHRQPPSPRDFIDALALQDSVNDSNPQIRPK
jgi:hypothetical protein